MKEGWLWLSILKTTASPSPMSTTPAFSPGPWITRGPVVGRVRSHFFEDLYEQCSFHIAEKMPSSVSVGSRPISWRMRCVLVRLQAVRGDEIGGDLGGDVHAGARAPRTLSNNPRPSVPPCSGSMRFSG